jgi:hypothetical protein
MVLTSLTLCFHAVGSASPSLRLSSASSTCMDSSASLVVRTLNIMGLDRFYHPRFILTLVILLVLSNHLSVQKALIKADTIMR